jgi:hypothetical protein
MKVIDNRGERDSERRTLYAKLREMQEARQLKEQEKRDKMISFTSNWIVEDVYTRAHSGVVTINESIQQVQEANRNKFFEHVLNNRANIDTVIIKDHEPNGYGHDYIVSIESDTETIEKLHQEARKLNLNYEDYLRGLYYTTALEMIKRRERAAEETVMRMKRTSPVDVRLEITQELREKLEAKFGQPKYSVGVLNFKIYDYGDMLLDLAKEYLGLK